MLFHLVGSSIFSKDVILNSAIGALFSGLMLLYLADKRNDEGALRRLPRLLLVLLMLLLMLVLLLLLQPLVRPAALCRALPPPPTALP